MVPLRGVFGATVGSLWGQYLFGGRPPQEITDTEVIDAFASDPVSLAVRPSTVNRAFDALAAKLDIEDGTHAMEELLPVGSQSDLERRFNWNNPFSKPGNIAGARQGPGIHADRSHTVARQRLPYRAGSPQPPESWLRALAKRPRRQHKGN